MTLDRLKDQNERYREHYDKLTEGRSEREAAELAVGGQFEEIGKLELTLLRKFGLANEHYVVDVGCGSGRLTRQLAQVHQGKYLGTDVVPELLEHARSLSANHDWGFRQVDDLTIPEADDSADFVCFFSVFTHLLHEQSFLYLREAARVLKPGGRIIFSFLEFAIPSHWAIFEGNLNVYETNHLNMFMDRQAIAAWAEHLDLCVEAILSGHEPQVEESVGKRNSLGQSVSVLAKNE
tara:strand:+ start:107 stop:814 length:708 start_codon:yes stop_codon:yes gene_type:complete